MSLIINMAALTLFATSPSPAGTTEDQQAPMQHYVFRYDMQHHQNAIRAGVHRINQQQQYEATLDVQRDCLAQIEQLGEDMQQQFGDSESLARLTP